MPLPVLEQAQRDLVALPGVGMSVMEISHRSKTFEDLLDGAIADIRELAGLPTNYKILMLQGGASLQFSMVPMNLLGPDDGRLHRHRLVGRQGAKEAKRVECQRHGLDESGQLHPHTRPAELTLTPGAATSTSRRTTRSRARSGDRLPDVATNAPQSPPWATYRV